jgi:cytochrome c-type biogenesis protein CcmE
MDPHRKRLIRLVVALSAAVILGAALVYTSFAGATDARTPSQLARGAQPGRSYQLTGRVAAGSVHRAGAVLYFRVQDRAGGTSIPVSYAGAVPDPFRAGREIIVDVRRAGGLFVGQRDSLVTKCPSKFTAKPPARAA